MCYYKLLSLLRKLRSKLQINLNWTNKFVFVCSLKTGPNHEIILMHTVRLNNAQAITIDILVLRKDYLLTSYCYLFLNIKIPRNGLNIVIYIP